jgi:hypothetical protein
MLALGTIVKTPYVRIEFGDIYEGVGVIIRKDHWLTGVREDHVVWQDGQEEPLSLYENPLYWTTRTMERYFLDEVNQEG